MANETEMRTLLLFDKVPVTVDNDGNVYEDNKKLIMELEPEQLKVHGCTDETLKDYLEAELTYDYWDNSN